MKPLPPFPVIYQTAEDGLGDTVTVSYTHLDVYKRQVMDGMQKNTTEVRNMKQYLLAVLFKDVYKRQIYCNAFTSSLKCLPLASKSG